MIVHPFQTKYLDIALIAWLFSLFVFVLLGNAASDIWLTVTACLLLVYSFATGQWHWLRTGWFQIAVLFWVWLLLTSALSQWPANAFKDSLTWIRFPLFAAALPVLIGLSSRSKLPNTKHVLLASLMAGLAIMITALIIEKLNNPEVTRLYGVWSKDQLPKAGWLIVGFGLPVALWALGRIFDHTRAALWGVPLVAIIIFAAFLTGEIYMTLSMLLGITLFLVVSQVDFKLLGGLLMMVTGAIGALLFFSPTLAERFEVSLTNRLPWLSSSDYHIPWMRGLETAQLNPLVGVGPRNYGSFCKESSELQALFDAGCFHHPHQLYIQTAAETGYIGLALFVLLVAALLVHILRGQSWRNLPTNHAAALCLVITALWPISTYSNAFGQHRNFFTWLIIAWALTLVGNMAQREGQDKTGSDNRLRAE